LPLFTTIHRTLFQQQKVEIPRKKTYFLEPVVAVSSSIPEKPPTSSRGADGSQFVDITEYLNMAQSDAAKKLGIPVSTLSKRWKEAVVGRKWPYRTVSRIDKGNFNGYISVLMERNYDFIA
jgi:hypothetical protein